MFIIYFYFSYDLYTAIFYRSQSTWNHNLTDNNGLSHSETAPNLGSVSLNANRLDNMFIPPRPPLPQGKFF